jgi:hypothetical protein
VHETLALRAAEPQAHGAAGSNPLLATRVRYGLFLVTAWRNEASVAPAGAQPAEGWNVTDTLNGNTEKVSCENPGAGESSPATSAIG